jgi:hypothetical protein
MIQSQLGPLQTCVAVLTGIEISQEDVGFAEARIFAALHHLFQHNHGGDFGFPTSTAHDPIIVPFQHTDFV